MDTDSFIVYIKTEESTQTMQKMLKQGLILQVTNYIDHFIKEKKEKNWFNERLIT